MASHYELRTDPQTGETRLEVKGFAELLEPELRGELVSDETRAKIVRGDETSDADTDKD